MGDNTNNMKSRRLHLLLFFIGISINLSSQIINIPDSTFKSYLTYSLGNIIDVNDDGEIDSTEAADCVVWIKVANKGIKDLTGIEAFISITQLYCNGNELDDLDVTKCVNLEKLVCYSNNLEVLDVTTLTKLDLLSCHHNYISLIDASNCTVLTQLAAQDNVIEYLDVSNNPLLELLYFNSNLLSGYMDLSMCVSLNNLSCGDNLLTELNLKNTPNLYGNFNSMYSDQLMCIEVDDVDYSNASWTNKDDWTEYSNDCSQIILTGIEEQNNLPPFFVVNKEVRIKTGTVSVFNTYGQLVARSSQTIYLNKGVYLVKHEESSVITKIVL